MKLSAKFFLMFFKRKYLNRHNAESTALGACIVSQVGFGMNLSDISIKHGKKITPSLKLKDAYEATIYHGRPILKVQ